MKGSGVDGSARQPLPDTSFTVQNPAIAATRLELAAGRAELQGETQRKHMAKLLVKKPAKEEQGLGGGPGTRGKGPGTSGSKGPGPSGPGPWDQWTKRPGPGTSGPGP